MRSASTMYAAHSAAREQREADARRVERVAARVGEQHDPGRREQHPEPVERRREPATATASGPANSIVTAMPSGIRSIAE